MNLLKLPSIYLADCSSSGWKDEEVIAYGRSCYAKGMEDAMSDEVMAPIIEAAIKKGADAGYAKGRADLLDRLTAGVEVPEPVRLCTDNRGTTYLGFNEEQLLEYGATQRLKLARAMHYPECWDTAAYPTLESALHEAYAWAKCNAHEGEVKHD